MCLQAAFDKKSETAIAPLLKRLNLNYLLFLLFSPSLTFELAAQVHVHLPEPRLVKTMEMASKVLISYAGSFLVTKTKMVAAVPGEAAQEPMVQVVAV